jgi:hypothetical protein
MSRVSDRNAMPHVRGRKKEKKKERKKEDDSNVTTDVDYGVALFPSWSKSISNPDITIRE